MVEADPDGAPDPLALPAPDPRALSALAAILALEPAVAGEVRGRTPARRRPRRQTGPTLDIGGADGGGPDGDGPDGDGPDVDG